MSKIIIKTTRKTKICLTAAGALALAFFMNVFLGSLHVNLKNVRLASGEKFSGLHLVENAKADFPAPGSPSPVVIVDVGNPCCCGCGGGCASSA